MAIDESAIKAIITPYDGDSNPYLKLLSTSLTELGVQVDLARFHRLPLYSAVRRHELPDIMHLQWHHSYFTAKRWPKAVVRTVLFYGQWLALRSLGVRFVWTVHNAVNHEARQAGWELVACRLLARVADSIIVHCSRAACIIGEAYHIVPDRLHVVPHGHYADWYPSPVPRREARHRLGLRDDLDVFLYFGSIREYKGVQGLLEAFGRIREESVRLLVAGRPSSSILASRIETQAEADSRVIADFRFVPEECLITYLGACDAVVLPYRRSLTSGAAVLAASSGRPIIAPDHGCVGELPSEAAILYDPREPESLQEALEEALCAQLPVMGSAAKEYVEQFPWSLVARETLRIYEHVLGR